MGDNKKLVDKKGLHTPKVGALTDTEKEVLRLITEEHLNLKQIELRRKCTRQAIYKHIKSLKKKGAFNLGNQALKVVDKSQGSCQPNQVRLHGQEFNIKILWQDQRYQKLLESSNILFLEGHTIKLYRNAIEVYAGEGTSFFGEDECRADKKAVIYWKKLFTRLEHELKVIIIKERTRNIKEVNHHYERGDSEICRNNLENDTKRIRVFCPLDGKLAFITDESFGGTNDETVHPITAKPDRGKIDKQVNDWRLHNPPTSSELATHIKQVTENQLMFAENMKSHIAAIKELSKGVQELREERNKRWSFKKMFGIFKR